MADGDSTRHDDPSAPDLDEHAGPFRDAEQWLAEQGIDREPIRVDPGDEDDRPPPSAREAARLAEEPPPEAPGPGGDDTDEQPGDEDTGGQRGELQDEVAEAVATARRSTAQAPKSEAQLADRLRDKGYPDVVVDLAMQRCREEGIVDDRAYAEAFVDERKAKGHGPFRIRKDLEKRGFERPLIEEVLAPLEEQDLEARAFDVAMEKARASQTADAETAFRRIVGYVARRGYPEALARKVARQAVFADRQDREAAER